MYCFFFQAEDGIRDRTVTGVQTCALPICDRKPDLRLSQRSWKKHWEKSAGSNERRPLRSEHSSPIGVSEKNQQAGITLSRQPECQQRGTDSIKQGRCDLRTQPNERQSKQRSRERILLERRIVWILPR